jgi:hypothetical protein
MNTSTRNAGAVASLLALAGVLAACGGGSSTSTSATSATPTSSSPTSSAAPGAGRGGQGGQALFNNPAVTTCLKAAGITLPARPSGSFTRPSGTFTRPSGGFSRPSGGFTRPSGARPSGARSGGGFFGDSAQTQQIQAALKACGITLPSGRPSAAAPSGSATTSG